MKSMPPSLLSIRRIIATLLIAASLPANLRADDGAGVAFFESKIRPVLSEHCYECHSVQSEKAKGGLRLDDREALLRGGDSGPALIPGNPGESLILTAILHDDPDLKMPPKKPRLPGNVLSDFETWIATGATDPREAASGKEGDHGNDFESRRKHWSFLAPVAPSLPQTTEQNWARTDLDRFVLAKLEQNELSPSPDADAVTLLRRLSFDLTGLPPTPEMAADFSLDQLEEVVDTMLASEGFGVRWGRHWLDVVRYAESNGKESNLAYPHAWRYRDYVIDAFNADLPYDRFLREQIAGDLLPAKSDAERARHLIATGFLAFGPKSLTEFNDEQFAADVADEQIDALSRSLLATSLACARCHDHKSDPVRMDDYYALAGIFKSTDTRFGTWVDSESNRGTPLVELPQLPGQIIPNPSIPKKELDELKSKLAELNAEEEAGRKMAEKAKADGIDLQKDFNEIFREALRLIWTRGPIVGKLNTVDEEGNALPLCMGALEAEKQIDSPLYERGETAHPVGSIPRAVPALFGLENEGPVPADQSGRLQLADWITDPGNPLTSRVIVNRIWSHLFRAGLVETVDNFGRTGATPSHPELLDFLALRFQSEGRSVKSLIREIVLSRTYRQSSVWRKECFEKDPDNRLLWRMSKRRLSAEEIRDAMLFVSGEINLSPRTGSLVAELTSQSIGMIPFNTALPADLDGSLHRSVYLPVMRDQLPDVLSLFDFAEPSLVTGLRDSTNVPPQALYLMNSEFVRSRAGALANQLLLLTSDPEAQIALAFQRCLNRDPDDTEQKLASEFLSHPDDPEKRLTDFCQALLAGADFRIAD